jgi:hypothetical protein
MKKFLYRMVLPAVVLAVVYHYGYSAGRSAGIRTSSVMPQITSAPVSVPPAPITAEARQPKIVETPDVPPPTAKLFRPKSGSSAPRLAPPLAAPSAPITPDVIQSPVGLVVERRAVVKSQSANSTSQKVVNQPIQKESKAVFRAPNVSESGTSELSFQLPALQPLKSVSAPMVLPPLAKPQSPPQESDCGCGK